MLGGERANVRPEGFDFGNSPREYADVDGAGRTLVLTTTNGTRLLLAAAARCETVLVASLLNLDAVVAAVRASGADEVAVLCAGVEGAFAIDDVYVAGRIAAGDRRRAGRVCVSRDQARAHVRDAPRTGSAAASAPRTSAASASPKTSRGARRSLCSTSRLASSSRAAPPCR